MKILCERSVLSEAVQNVSRAVSAKSTIPALEGILLKAQNDALTLTGYDLELGISTTIQAKVEQPGAIVLSAKIFADIIRRMPSERVSISVDEKLLTEIDGEVTHFTILGMDPADYPEYPSVEDTTEFKLSDELLKSMIDQTLFAIAVSDAKPVHTGSLFDLSDKTLHVVSVDGYRLAMRTEPINTEETLSFIVPGKTLSEVSKLLAASEEEVSLMVAKKHIIFDIHGYQVVSRLLEGEFLDYKAAIPQNSQTTVAISTREFIDSIERTSLIISDRLKSPLRVNFDDNLIKMSCTTPIGKSYDELCCKVQGDAVEMGFNNKYLLDALRAACCDEVKLIINGPLSPMKVVPTGSDEFLFLVLPVRLKAEG